MANKYRGEVSIEIGGKTYPIALTLDAIGRLAEAYKVETIQDVEARMLAFRASDAVPTLEALLAAGGHTVDREEIGRLSPMAFGEAIAGLFVSRKAPQEGAEQAGPPKRGKAPPSPSAST